MSTTDLARRSPPSTLPAVCEADLMTSVVAGMKPTTRKAYTADMGDFARFVGVDSAEAAANLLIAGSAGQANAAALAYKTDMIGRGLAVATINRRLAALRCVVNMACTLGRVVWTLRVKGLKAEGREDRRGPGTDGWRAMLTLATAEAAGGEP
jgi:integrase/recombinase XerC